MTSSGCLSRGSRGRDCRVVCVLYICFKEICVLIGFGLHERRAQDVMRSWGLRGAGKAVGVWAWGSLICVGRALSADCCIPLWLV